MYLVHSIIKTCVFCVIVFTISGISSAQAVKADGIESNSPGEKIGQIAKLLESIPEYSGNLYIGPLRIYPSLEVSGTYDDNVFGTSDKSITANKDRDFYETYKPTISLALPIRDHSIAFDYGFEIYEYARDYKPSTVNQDRVNRRFGGAINLNFLNGFSVSMSDRVSIIRSPASITRRNNERVQFPGDDPIDEPENPDEIEEEFGINTPTLPRESHNNNASIAINLPDFFDKLDFSLQYTNTDASYKERRFKGSDRNESTFGGRVIIKPLPRINITTGILYKYIRYDKSERDDDGQRESKDSIYRKIPFYISWQPTVKSTFFINYSYNRRDNGRNNPNPNYTGYNATLGYRFNVTERDNLTIKIERSLKEQQFQSTTVGGTTVFDDNPYFFSQIDIDWIHRLSTRFSILFSPTFQHLRFREKQFFTSRSGTAVLKHEKEDSIRFEIKGRYDAPRGWLFGEVSYSYEYRDSNLVGGDLEKNVAQISIGLSF